MERSDRPHRVVIIEDDQGCSDLITEIVEDMGYLVTAYDRADEALALVRDRRPVLVILDVILPDGDGFAILRAIRQDPEMKSIPVLLCTAALLDAADSQQPEQDPRTAILAKPFHIETFARVLNELIAKG